MKLRAYFVIVGFLSMAAAVTLAQAPAPTASLSSTQVPRLIKFSGVAKDEAGKSKTGLVGVTFALYKDQEGGSPLWVETQNVQADATGHYTALLGSASVEGVPLNLFSSGEAQWLGVQVQEQAAQPRVLLVSVPYALKAHEAETLSGKSISDFVLLNKSAAAATTAGSSPAVSNGASGPKTPSAANGPTSFIGTNTTQIVTVTQKGTGVGLAATATTRAAVAGAITGKSNTAVYGLASNTAKGSNAAGVTGVANSETGPGVQGITTSPAGFGVQGVVNSSTGGTAIQGLNNATSGVSAGVSGQSASTGDGSAGVVGNESASSGQVYGVVGVSNSATTNASGVSGFEGATTGEVYGVRGGTNSTTSGAAGVIGFDGATTGQVFGVFGYTSSATNFATGVVGNANATTGQVTGVSGTSVSTSGTGVSGNATATTGNTFGVFGQAASPNGTGIAGYASATSGPAIGVIGATNSPAGVGAAFTNSGGGTSAVIEGNGAGGNVFTLDASGNLTIKGKLTKGSGSFKIDHPLDPANKFLSHSFVESPDMMNVYNGNITTNRHGFATVNLPDYFESLNGDFRYQLTVIGQFAQAIVKREIANNRFTIKTNKPLVRVSWQVTGIRHDAYANQYRIPVEEEKASGEQGYYLHPEVFGQPESKSISAARKSAQSSPHVVADASRQ